MTIRATNSNPICSSEIKAADVCSWTATESILITRAASSVKKSVNWHKYCSKLFCGTSYGWMLWYRPRNPAATSTPRTSCPSDPGSKKTKMPTKITLRSASTTSQYTPNPLAASRSYASVSDLM